MEQFLIQAMKEGIHTWSWSKPDLYLYFTLSPFKFNQLHCHSNIPVHQRVFTSNKCLLRSSKSIYGCYIFYVTYLFFDLCTWFSMLVMENLENTHKLCITS
jgi:hypothetical protein